jgi:hypothetical protein
MKELNSYYKILDFINYKFPRFSFQDQWKLFQISQMYPQDLKFIKIIQEKFREPVIKYLKRFSKIQQLANLEKYISPQGGHLPVQNIIRLLTDPFFYQSFSQFLDQVPQLPSTTKNKIRFPLRLFEKAADFMKDAELSNKIKITLTKLLF